MDTLLEKLNDRLQHWRPEIAEQARYRISELIDMADSDTLDLGRSHAIEQEVLDLLDSDTTR